MLFARGFTMTKNDTVTKVETENPEPSDRSARFGATRESRHSETTASRLSEWAWPEKLSGLRIQDFRLFSKRNLRIDIVDRDEEWLLVAELPGVGKDDLELSVTDDGVKISAQRPMTDYGKILRREISGAPLERTVTLPGRVLGDQASAKLTDGMLEVRLPKAAISVGHAITPE